METLRPAPRRTRPGAPTPVVLEGRGWRSSPPGSPRCERRHQEMEQALVRRAAVADPGARGTTGRHRPGRRPRAATEPGRRGGRRRPRSGRRRSAGSAPEDRGGPVERHERYVDMIGRQLDRLGVTLTSEQRTQLIDTTIAYRDRVRDSPPGLRREARKTRPPGRRARDSRAEYEQAVRQIVPSGDSQKVIDEHGSLPGLRLPPAGGGSPGAGELPRVQRPVGAGEPVGPGASRRRPPGSRAGPGRGPRTRGREGGRRGGRARGPGGDGRRAKPILAAFVSHPPHGGRTCGSAFRRRSRPARVASP